MHTATRWFTLCLRATGSNDTMVTMYATGMSASGSRQTQLPCYDASRMGSLCMMQNGSTTIYLTGGVVSLITMSNEMQQDLWVNGRLVHIDTTLDDAKSGETRRRPMHALSLSGPWPMLDGQAVVPHDCPKSEMDRCRHAWPGIDGPIPTPVADPFAQKLLDILSKPSDDDTSEKKAKKKEEKATKDRKPASGSGSAAAEVPKAPVPGPKRTIDKKARRKLLQPAKKPDAAGGDDEE